MQPYDQAIAKLAAAQYGLFSREQAQRLGASPRMIERRLASMDWERLHRSVYGLTGYRPSWRRSLLAACLAFGVDASASHGSAWGLWRFPGMLEGALDLIVPGRSPRGRAGVRVHRAGLRPADRTVIDAIPVTSATRTLFDMATFAPRDLVEEAVDDALRRRLTSIARLRWQLESSGGSGIAGTRMLREILLARGNQAGGAESVLETRLFRLLKRARIDGLVSQHEIMDAEGAFVARVDFAIPTERIAIEVDGYRWHSGRGRWERDLARRNRLTALGWQVLHVTSRDIDQGAEQIIRTLREAAAKSTAGSSGTLAETLSEGAGKARRR